MGGQPTGVWGCRFSSHSHVDKVRPIDLERPSRESKKCQGPQCLSCSCHWWDLTQLPREFLSSTPQKSSPRSSLPPVAPVLRLASEASSRSPTLLRPPAKLLAASDSHGERRAKKCPTGALQRLKRCGVFHGQRVEKQADPAPLMGQIKTLGLVMPTPWSY